MVEANALSSCTMTQGIICMITLYTCTFVGAAKETPPFACNYHEHGDTY